MSSQEPDPRPVKGQPRPERWRDNIVFDGEPAPSIDMEQAMRNLEARLAAL